MRTGRPKVQLLLSEPERVQLPSFARSRSLPAALSARARIVLSGADGEPNNAFAERPALTKATEGKWRTRFIERCIAGLYDDVRPGKPRTIDDERVAQLIKTTLFAALNVLDGAGLAARPRWHMHFIPTYSSWLNQVDRFVALITDKTIRCGSFTSVKQPVQRIDHFVTAHNENCQPFRWTATADSILEKPHRLCSRISGTGHLPP